MAKQSEITIDLSPAEELLRKLLLDCRDHIVYNSHDSTNLDIWFVGGWVRDKLLGGESQDIDVALSSMTGAQFGKALDQFSRSDTEYIAEAQRLGLPPTIKGLHIINRNPEKSKHLEPGTMEIFGLPVDFVNLRKEVYREESRNPQVEFGTTVEDAYRRDATINSIFYNLNRRRVEDHTQMGLSDLAAGIIRTPLQPTQTFMDDPLRILRLVRFASRLGFQIDQETAQAMKDPLVQTTFNVKITRERVGIEIEKMIKGPDPLTAFEFLYESGLYSPVFLGPPGYLSQALLHAFPRSEPDIPWPNPWPLAFRTLAFLLQHEFFWESEAREHIWLMAAWAPLAPLRITDIEKVVKSATGAIKTTSETSKILGDCLKNMDSVHASVRQVATASAGITRSALGMAVRSWGRSWKLQVLYALLADAISQVVDDGTFADLLDGYSKFMDHVFDQGLQNARLAKPILNGSELKTIFNLKQSGAFLKVALGGLVQWQFDHEHASKTDAIEWVLTQRENFHIP
ncbi:poly(A) polymerase [Penicillium bovifimosum]|uniref:Poly(A) polymerase n=1 Tax=Penicillium bovifimosum TaxID=126998 RepID=A0A9W9LA25_9EURO|nr:poly(A) polymerase [Penicillium bovifimosum]KAJ5146079.1 poly(A) polymerase [Penicillium bovifimosum]